MNDTEYGQLRVNHMITGNRLATRVATVTSIYASMEYMCCSYTSHFLLCEIIHKFNEPFVHLDKIKYLWFIYNIHTVHTSHLTPPHTSHISYLTLHTSHTSHLSHLTHFTLLTVLMVLHSVRCSCSHTGVG